MTEIKLFLYMLNEIFLALNLMGLGSRICASAGSGEEISTVGKYLCLLYTKTAL
jgi:hypothetical protein